MLCVIHTLHLPRISGLFPHQWNEQIDSCPSGHWRPSETLQAVYCLPQRRSLSKTMNKDTRGQNLKGENLSLLKFQERLKWIQKSNMICFELLLQKRFKMFWQGFTNSTHPPHWPHSCRQKNPNPPHWAETQNLDLLVFSCSSQCHLFQIKL